MKDRNEVGRKALRSARELAHLATSVAAEAANLARALESFGGTQSSVAASFASIEAAKGAFNVDELALTASPQGPSPATLHEIFLQTEACLESAEQAIHSARQALRAASTGMGHGSGSAAGDS